MSDPKNCALNPDSTLKDTSQISFFNSPSDKHTIGEFGSASDVQPKSGNVVSSDDDHLPTTVELSRGSKGKVPTTCVRGKWVVKPSLKVHNSDQQLVHVFFKKTFMGKQTGFILVKSL